MSKKHPNILLFLPDQWRPDFLGCAGDLPIATPNVDRLAERGVRFTRATTPSPVCAPARACLASGRDYPRCGVPGNKYDFPLETPTFYAALRDSGYTVGGVGKFDLHKATLDWGLDGSRSIHEWGFTHGIDSEGKLDAVRAYLQNGSQPKGPYMKYLADRGLADVHARDFEERDAWLGTEPTPLPDDAYCDNWIAENGLRLLRDFPSDSPWFLVVNFTGPHNPQDITVSMRERWNDVEFPPAVANTTNHPAVLADVRRNYAAMCENIDRHLGRYLEELEASGAYDDTVVIFASDHGEMLGDNDRWGKSTWYQPSIGVPLVAAGPGIVSGGVSDALVQLHDLNPTVLEIAGAPVNPGTDAVSFRPILEGVGGTPRDVAVGGLAGWRYAWDGRRKLVLEGGSPVAAFDHEHDLHETRNICADSATSVPEGFAHLSRAIAAVWRE